MPKANEESSSIVIQRALRRSLNRRVPTTRVAKNLKPECSTRIAQLAMPRVRLPPHRVSNLPAVTGPAPGRRMARQVWQ